MSTFESIFGSLAAAVLLIWLYEPSKKNKILGKIGESTYAGTKKFLKHLKEKKEEEKKEEGEEQQKKETPSFASASVGSPPGTSGPPPVESPASAWVSEPTVLQSSPNPAPPVPPVPPQFPGLDVSQGPEESLTRVMETTDVPLAHAVAAVVPSGSEPEPEPERVSLIKQYAPQGRLGQDLATQEEVLDEPRWDERNPEVATPHVQQPEESGPELSGLTPTAEEATLLARLTPAYWQTHAASNNLRGLAPADVRLTQAGVVFSLPLSGTKWTAEKVAHKGEYLRVLLDVRTETQLSAGPGASGSFAEVAVRTRRVTDGMDMRYRIGRASKGHFSLGVDTVTGEEITLPLAAQIHVAGAKGSGKSWLLRPAMAEASQDSDYLIVYIDPKRVEGALWRGVIRTAMGFEEVEDVLLWARGEMERRQKLMSDAGRTVWSTDLGPWLIFAVDEGRELLSLLRRAEQRRKKDAKLLEEDDLLFEEDPPCLEDVIRLSSMGRAWGMFLWWITQYPMTSGPNPGIDTNILANVDYEFCLRVGKRQHAEVALGVDADYGPHLIPTANERFDSRGHGYLAGHGPRLIRGWTLKDEHVNSLPPSSHLSSSPSSTISRAVAVPEPQQLPPPAPVAAPVAQPAEEPPVEDLSAAEITGIVSRTALAFVRKAEKEAKPLSRRDFQVATNSKYRTQIPNLTDEAIAYAMSQLWLAQLGNGSYILAPSNAE